MELKEMPPAVLMLVLVGIIIGIGLTILGTLSTDIRTTTSATNDQFNATNTSCVDLTHDYIDTGSASFVNYTNGVSVSPTCFTFDEVGTKSGTCVTLNEEVSAACASLQYKFVNASYTYGAANTQSVAVADTLTGIAGFTTWLSIIVIVLAAAIIVTLVIRSFKP